LALRAAAPASLGLGAAAALSGCYVIAGYPAQGTWRDEPTLVANWPGYRWRAHRNPAAGRFTRDWTLNRASPHIPVSVAVDTVVAQPGREASAAAQLYTGPISWMVDITTRGGGVYRFADDAVTFGGNGYQPYLRLSQGPRFTRSLAADFGEIELLNADLIVSAALRDQQFEGALCELRQFLRGLDEAVLTLRGRLTEQEESDSGARFRLVSELDPAQIAVHGREYAQLCTLRFAQSICGYDAANLSWASNLSATAADIFSLVTIGNSGLSQTVNVHADRTVVITVGTGKGQKRRIRSNSATTLTIWWPWTTIPDATSKFAVYTFTKGAPRLLFTPTSVVLEQQASSADSRSVTSTALGMASGEHIGHTLRIVSGTGAGQSRKIGANSGQTITIEENESAFSPAPDSSSVFRVLLRSCPKDFLSCEDRARTERFDAFPTLVPLVAAALAEGDPDTLPPGTDPGDFPTGGGGGTIPN